MKRLDLTNQIFGSLQAIEIDKERYKKDKTNKEKRIRIYWKCKCLKCGKIVSVRGENLRSGNTKGCGCDKFEKSAKLNRRYNKYEYDFNKDCIKGYASNTNNPFWIDIEDYKKIAQYCWYENNYGYLITRLPKSKKRVFLHRMIVLEDFDKNVQIDHINRNTYDCRRNNLRECNSLQNSRNKGINKRNTSGYTGVSFSKQDKKWRAFVSVNNKYISLGYYKTKEEAIQARLKGEKQYYGEFSPN